jgi:hypothetical protein
VQRQQERNNRIVRRAIPQNFRLESEPTPLRDERHSQVQISGIKTFVNVDYWENNPARIAKVGWVDGPLWVFGGLRRADPRNSTDRERVMVLEAFTTDRRTVDPGHSPQSAVRTVDHGPPNFGRIRRIKPQKSREHGLVKFDGEG